MAILNSENAIGDLRKDFVMSRDQDGRALLRNRSEQFHYDSRGLAIELSGRAFTPSWNTDPYADQLLTERGDHGVRTL
jgi:hypothetical protein